MAARNRQLWPRIIGIVVSAAVTVVPASAAPAAAVTRLSSDGVQRAAAAPDAPVDALARGITAFGYRFSQVTAAPPENWVVSPVSIGYAFAMVRAGARGETGTEIDGVFGFPPVGTDEAFNAATRRLAGSATSGSSAAAPGAARPATLLVNNAIFTAQQLRIEKPFLRTLAAQYGAGVYPVDFHSPRTIRTINEWVRAQTAGRIPTLFDRLDPDAAAVLANTVYLRADWEHEFDRSATVPAPFTRADGHVGQVPTMHLAADLRYASGAGWQTVELPYAHSDLAMWVMVPTGPAPGEPAGAGAPPGPADLLAPASMAAVGAALRPAYVSVALPRWDFGTNIDLDDPLVRLGVRRAFDPGTADFSGISGAQLYIDQAVHRATVTVDERGTEAAAATGISMMPTSARVPPELVVRADRPFAFAVVHRPTGLPVFVGHVADPAAHG
ncbi:serpin family protein [Planosporangium sp. 12N6]|uniref:serpin family protein n=1 Tax=Planosporangium spinosum TaxID=3402278 RepID=UPI003CEE41BF